MVGQWTPVQQFPYIAGHSHLLPNGKVLFWPTFSLGNNPQLWDPVTNTTTAATRASFNIFCSGHSFLENGKLFVTGGHNGSSGFGFPYASVYDPTNDLWTNTANMNDARWYPTNTTLANGDVLVVSGYITPNVLDTLPQVWQAKVGTWRDLTNAQLSQPLYPNMFLAPNGKVAYLGPLRASKYLDTSGTGTWSTLATQNFANARDYGNFVMYDAGKVLAVGGSDPPTNTAEVIDLNSATPGWVTTASMGTARRQANATLLPDGKVFVTGGSSGGGFDDQTHPVLTTELWDPASGTWTTMASITTYRGYHSTALLLPDGRVLSAGGEQTGATYEVYSPPYLFKGARPTITSAPASVGYGQSFFVQTPDGTRIANVNWIAVSSVTHSNNMSQRLLHLSFSQTNGGLNITSPASSNLSPPGPYMLFLVDTNGIPSVAKIVQNTLSTSSMPNAPSGLTATAVSGEIDLQWVDNSLDETGFAVERSLDGTNFAQIATTSSNVATFADSDLSSSITYFYRVRAQGTAADSSYSNVAYATTAIANIPLVQKAAVTGTNVSSVSAIFPGANASGNLLVAFVRASTTTQTVSVNDTLGNQYVQAVRQDQASDKHQIRIFYAANSIAGPNSVTATFSGTNAHPFLAIFEYSGLSTTQPLDQTVSAQGSGTAVSTAASAATRSANELVFAGLGLQSNSPAVVTAGGGFSIELQDAQKGFSRAATENRFATATGTFAGTFTLSASAKWSAALATFTSSGPVAPPPLAITTSSLPNGTVGTAYSANLAATGGRSPYTWSLADGSSLPPGVTLSSSGTISGTPTAAGTANFTVEMSDSSTSIQSTSKLFSITIDPAITGPPIALVQSAAAKGSATTSVSQPFATANASGNLIVAFVRMSSATQTVQLTDTAGNTYTEAVGQVQSTDGHQIHIFYAKNIAGGPNTVTATFSATNNFPWLAIYEYSGLSTSAPLDKVASSQGSATSVNSGATAITTSSNELVFAGVGLPSSSARTVTAGNGFALLQQNAGAPSTSRAANEHVFVASTGQFAGTFTLNGTANWSAAVATFKQ